MAMRRSMSVTERNSGLFRKEVKETTTESLLGRHVEFVEDCYMSSVKAECRLSRFKGVYHPPESDRSTETLNISNQDGKTFEPLPGLSLIEGRMAMLCGYISIRGSWRHVDSDCLTGSAEASGPFEMQSVSNRSADEFVGWWQMGADSDVKHDWKWTKRDSRNLPTRLVESVWMDRYAMFCAWLFLLQTCMQLISVTIKLESSMSEPTNLFFNLTYATCYTSFLVAFGSSSAPKELLYTLGVALYTVGYFVFAAIYYGTLGNDTLYHIGAWLFLVGSISLMLASAPKGRGCQHAYLPHRIQSSIWWGSLMFLLGSAVLAYDALKLGEPWANGVLGLSFFTVGRCFFVRGSQTKRCTFIFLSVDAFHQLLCFCKDGSQTCAVENITFGSCRQDPSAQVSLNSQYMASDMEPKSPTSSNSLLGSLAMARKAWEGLQAVECDAEEGGALRSEVRQDTVERLVHPPNPPVGMTLQLPMGNEID